MSLPNNFLGAETYCNPLRQKGKRLEFLKEDMVKQRLRL